MNTACPHCALAASKEELQARRRRALEPHGVLRVHNVCERGDAVNVRRLFFETAHRGTLELELGQGEVLVHLVRKSRRTRSFDTLADALRAMADALDGAASFSGPPTETR